MVTGRMEEEAKCKLGKKTSPTQTHFLPFLLAFVSVLSQTERETERKKTQGGINLAKLCLVSFLLYFF